MSNPVRSVLSRVPPNLKRGRVAVPRFKSRRAIQRWMVNVTLMVIIVVGGTSFYILQVAPSPATSASTSANLTTYTQSVNVPTTVRITVTSTDPLTVTSVVTVTQGGTATQTASNATTVTMTTTSITTISLTSTTTQQATSTTTQTSTQTATATTTVTTTCTVYVNC